MFIEERFYGIECDRCHNQYESYGDFSFMSSESDVLENAREDGWEVIDGKHYCPDCYECNPDPDHDDDHEYIPKHAFPPYIAKLKQFLKIIGGWVRQEQHDDWLWISFYTEAHVKFLREAWRIAIDDILEKAVHEIEVVDKEAVNNAMVIIKIKLKTFKVGDRVKVIHHQTFNDCYGKEGEVVREAPREHQKGCYAVHIFEDENPDPHYFIADDLELIEKK